ncbi:MAG: glycosyltransferase family 2 protein [Lachnospiraceae bacterium]|nr:glycosyltransferase family 2 protein [Lachnospiraceae bacterium]
MKKVMILLTCHERREKTEECLKSLLQDAKAQTQVVVVDAGSRDGTVEMLKAFPVKNGSLKLIRRGPELFWNGGMRVAMNYAAAHCAEQDCIMLVNDDVRFLPGALDAMLKRLEENGADAVVGATRAGSGEQSYGGVRMLSRHLARYELIPPSVRPESCDTFNCNALLLTKECFLSSGNLDGAYVHSMGDYDYGMRLKRAGRIVINSADYVGVCDDNDMKGSWRDTGLSRAERLKKKEGPKGLPARDWYHYVRKNYGAAAALWHSITPYIRILIGK